MVGALLLPSASAPCPAVIALGGAGGGLSEGGAETLASEGFAALALAYFEIDRLPHELVEIPLEYFEKAIAWLRAQPGVDAERVAVVGNSKGGELALLLGATYPEDVKAIVGYSPSAVVWQGIAFDREVYHGGPDPLVPPREARTVRRVGEAPSSRDGSDDGSWLDERPISSRAFYQRALQDETAVEEGSIAVEKIGGPVFLVSGTDDRLWPSTRLSQMAIERLNAHDHLFPREHLRYEGAGHMIALPGYEPEAS